MTETDGRLWPMGGVPRVYGGKERVIDPDFDSLRAALDKVQGQIDPEARFRWEMIGRQIVRPRIEIPGQITIDDLLGGG